MMSHTNTWTPGFVSILFKTSFLQRLRREVFMRCRHRLIYPLTPLRMVDVSSEIRDAIKLPLASHHFFTT